MKDGNCWMTQNLDLDLVEGKTLTPADSDVTENWTPGVGEGTIGEGNLSLETWPKDNTVIRSYDAGLYVYATPTTVNNCGNQSSLAACTGKGWVNVSDMTPSNNPNFYVNPNTDKVVNNATNTYDAHYLVGNYYSWVTATANSGSDLTEKNANASSSICPAAWRLPISRQDAETRPLSDEKSFAKLFRSYGWKWETPPSNSWDGYLADYVQNGIYDARLQPFYLLYGGRIDSGYVGIVGGQGRWWSSTIGSDTGGHCLIITSEATIPTADYARRQGSHIRCVAK